MQCLFEHDNSNKAFYTGISYLDSITQALICQINSAVNSFYSINIFCVYLTETKGGQYNFFIHLNISRPFSRSNSASKAGSSARTALKVGSSTDHIVCSLSTSMTAKFNETESKHTAACTSQDCILHCM